MDKEVLDKIKLYNELTERWFKGIEWLERKDLTEELREKGEERLIMRLNQLNEVYKELRSLGVNVVPEEIYEIKEDIK